MKLATCWVVSSISRAIEDIDEDDVDYGTVEYVQSAEKVFLIESAAYKFIQDRVASDESIYNSDTSFIVEEASIELED